MIGRVPEGWRVEKLGELCDFVRGPFGGALKKEIFQANGYAIYEQQHAIYNQFNDIRYFIDEDKFNEMKRFELNSGDLIMSCSGTMGKIAIVPENIQKGIINQALLKLTPLNTIIVDYLKLWMESRFFQISLQKFSQGAAIQNVASVSVLKNIETPLPPLPQQEKIVRVLDLSAVLVEKQQTLLKKYDLFLKSKFIEMFGDPISNPMGWEVVKFEDILFLQRGHDLPTYERKKSGSVKVFGSNGVLDYHDEAKVKGGGVITGRSGTLGKVHYTFEDYWPLNTTLFSKDLKGNNIVFLAYFLELFKVDRFTQGAGVPTLNRNLVHKEKTYRVPTTLQTKFAQIVEKVEHIKRQESQKLSHLQTLHNSLMDRAFKGEIA